MQRGLQMAKFLAGITNTSGLKKKKYIYIAESIKPQLNFDFHVWCDILYDAIWRPFIFDGHLTRERYLDFLQNQLEFTVTSSKKFMSLTTKWRIIVELLKLFKK